MKTNSKVPATFELTEILVGLGLTSRSQSHAVCSPMKDSVYDIKIKT